MEPTGLRPSAGISLYTCKDVIKHRIQPSPFSEVKQYLYSDLDKRLLGVFLIFGKWPLKFWGVIWPKDSLVLGWSGQKTPWCWLSPGTKESFAQITPTPRSLLPRSYPWNKIRYLYYWGMIWQKDSLVLGWSGQKTPWCQGWVSTKESFVQITPTPRSLFIRSKIPKTQISSQLFGPKYCFIPKPDWLIWCRFSQGFRIWS